MSAHSEGSMHRTRTGAMHRAPGVGAQCIAPTNGLSRRRFLALAAAGAALPLAAACSWLPGATRARAAGPSVPRVVRYGARQVDDLTADAIIAALRAVPALGGEVSLPAGTYRIDKTIEIPTDNVVLRGAGPDTVLQATDASFVVFYLNRRKLVTVADLRIVGAGQDGNGGTGINASEVERCAFENLRIERCGSADAAGIFLNKSTSNRVVGCHLESNGRGIHVYQDSTSNLIDRCTGHQNAKEMIFLTTGCSDCTVSNCASDGDGASAPAVSIAIHRSDRTSLTDTTIQRTGQEQGVEIAASADNVVSGCTISESKWAGLHIVNSIRTVVTANRIVDNQQSGILVRAAGSPEDIRRCDDLVISGNEISRNDAAGRTVDEVSWAGIEIEAGDNIRIEQNVLADNHASAIYIHPGNTGTRIDGNQISGEHGRTLVNRGELTAADIAG
jgi:parallel beta-helix repeat protein